MTWPFENDTSGIVKRISNRSISANRKRNIFIVLTIALASALLSAIVLYGFGVMQETQNRNQKTAPFHGKKSPGCIVNGAGTSHRPRHPVIYYSGG